MQRVTALWNREWIGKLTIGLCALVGLVACGATPTTVAPTAALAPISTALPATSIGALVTAAPVAPTAMAPTAMPTEAATESAELSTPVQKGYGTRVLVKGLAVMVEDTIKQAQSGELKGPDALGRMIGIGAIYKAIEENLAKDAPDPALQAGWEQGRAVLPKIQDVLAQLNSDKITPAQAADMLPSIQSEADQMLAAAESDLGDAYGGDPAQLKELRDKSIADLQKSLEATPAP